MLALIEKGKRDCLNFFYFDLNARNWEIRPAPCPSDIIWPNFNKKRAFSLCQNVLLNILLFMFAVIILNPNVIWGLIFVQFMPKSDDKEMNPYVKMMLD